MAIGLDDVVTQQDNYRRFVASKGQAGGDHGFEPLWMPDFLFDFQRSLVEWALRRGRAAIFADCGLGKTIQQLVWAENVVRKANRPVLILTPLAVSQQTVHEAEKFGIDCVRSRDGSFRGSRIVVTNYERLHHFDPDDFARAVCDESSGMKDFEGARQKEVTEFLRRMPYRLLCTATAAPNDYIELGTSSEALGELGRMDMLLRFFKNDGKTLHLLGTKHGDFTRDRWRFKHHAEQSFWKWVCSWARACRKPSDLGFDDGRFILPELVTREHMVKADRPRGGYLFDVPAETLQDQRDERRLTMDKRCEMVAQLTDHGRPALVWCHLNPEGDLLERIIPGSVQVSGSDPDEAKEEAFQAFVSGQARVLVTKPKIGGLGLNFQHCSHVTFFPSHSFEQFYQGVRRCWRFGQDRPVIVDIVTSEGEAGVMANLRRKADAADVMFSSLIAWMNDAIRIGRSVEYPSEVRRPTWL